MLSNGIRVVSRKFSEYSSVSVGVWIKTGAVNESQDENGLSHFIEHMAFRGTDRYDQYEITDRIDAIGGHLSAFTTKEYTCFLAKVRRQDLAEAVDLLAQLVGAPRFEERHILLEQSIVLDEIAMYQDDPEDLVCELAYAASIPGYRPILGTPHEIERYTRSVLFDFYRRQYCGSNMILAVAGAYEDSVLDMLESAFSGIPCGTERRDAAFVPATACVHCEKKLEQAQLLILFPTQGRSGDSLYELFALSHLLGEGHSSRLFKTLRGEHGLVYAVTTDLELYRHNGFFEIALSTTEDKLERALGLIADEIRSLRDGGISDDELRAARAHMESSTILSLDGSQHYMEFLGHAAATGATYELEEVLAAIAAIDSRRMNRLLRELFGQIPTVASVGDFGDEDAARYHRVFLARLQSEVKLEDINHQSIEKSASGVQDGRCCRHGFDGGERRTDHAQADGAYFGADRPVH